MIDSKLREQLREQGYEVEIEAEKSPFPVQQFLAAILAKRRLILLMGTAGLLLGAALGTVTSKKYTATVMLLPPEASSITTPSTLAALNGNPFATGLSSGGLLSTRSTGGTIIGILNSPAVGDALVSHFHLTDVFQATDVQSARKRLSVLTVMDEDKKSGILSVSVTCKNPALARDLANEYVVQLNQTLSDVNTSSAHRERVFLDQRIASLKGEMDAMALQLSTFSSSTGTLNPQLQGQSQLELIAKAQAQLSVAQSDLSGLRAVYADENTRVRSAQARIASLRGQLAALESSSDRPEAARQHGSGSADGAEISAVKPNQALPTLRQLPSLGVTYTGLSQQLLAEQAVYATLIRQHELARVEEAKEIPSVKMLSVAQLPVKPSSPTVLFTSLVTGFGSLVFALVAVALWSLLRFAPASMPFKAAWQALSNAAHEQSLA